MINQILYLILAISAVDISVDMQLEKSTTPRYYHAITIFLLYFTLILILRKLMTKKIQTYWPHHNSLSLYATLNPILSLLTIMIMYIQVSYLNILAFLDYIELLGTTKILKRFVAIFLFFFYQSITWYTFSNISNLLYNTNFSKLKFVEHNLRIYLPLLIPWLIVVILEEIFNAWTSFFPKWILTNHWLILLAIMLLFFLLFPPVILKIWGCKRVAHGSLAFLTEFLEKENFSFRGIYLWPIYEGKLYTAGIIGPLPWLRYILITESLLNVLNPLELKSVMAHEVAHARLRHMWLYLVILLVFMGVLYNSYEYLLYFLSKISLVVDISIDERIFRHLEYISVSFMIVLIFCFLRYIFGYFMRNFERQADLYGASIAGVQPLIDALEKIGYYSGNIRDLPSWHHFSIKERVEVLKLFEREPSFLKRHNRKLYLALSIYLATSTLFLAISSKLDVNKLTLITLYEGVVSKKLIENPGDEELLLALAQISLEKKEVRKAIGIYEGILNRNPNQHIALNNLAWILVTEKDFLDPKRALLLAKRAVELEKNPAYLDTLAEAYLLVGDIDKAIEAGLEAIKVSKDEKEKALFQRRYEEFLSKIRAKKDLKGY